jgi:AcrR family transcriptional regulator
MARRKKTVSRNPDETRALLIDAAEAEFNEAGFHGTDTNRIARRAGYAPQTFYRHFADKIEIFLSVYERWWRAESDAVGKTLGGGGKAGLARAADVMISFHVKWRGFRRSLRHLSAEDERVRAARIAARKAQIVTAKQLVPDTRKTDAEVVAMLLILERLCDAAAEGEFADLGFSRNAARHAVIAVLDDFYATERSTTSAPAKLV